MSEAIDVSEPWFPPGQPNVPLIGMYLALLVFPIWASRRSRKRFSKKLQATMGTPSRRLSIFSMYMTFYLFIFISFGIYWTCLLLDVMSCYLEEDCTTDFFKKDIGYVEFWYLVLLHIYTSVAWFLGQVKMDWTPVPYSGTATVGLATTIYRGQTRTIYYDGTTTILRKGMSSTIFFPRTASTVYVPVTATVSTIIPLTTISTTIYVTLPPDIRESYTDTEDTKLDIPESGWSSLDEL